MLEFKIQKRRQDAGATKTKGRRFLSALLIQVC
jgi:hypothetical protein